MAGEPLRERCRTTARVISTRPSSVVRLSSDDNVQSACPKPWRHQSPITQEDPIPDNCPMQQGITEVNTIEATLWASCYFKNLETAGIIFIRHRFADLRAVVSALPAQQRRLIEQLFWQKRTDTEVADALGTNQSTINPPQAGDSARSSHEAGRPQRISKFSA